MNPGTSLPKCKAMLLCERTIVEQGTGKVSLIGLFSGFTLSSVPGKTLPAELFLQVTDAEGSYHLEVQVQDLREGKVIARTDGINLEVNHRLGSVNIMLPLPSLPVSHEGLYDVVVLANAEEIDRQQFVVISPAPDAGEIDNE